MWIKALHFKRKMSNNSKILIKHNNAIQENWKLENRGEERETLTLWVFSDVLCLRVWNIMHTEWLAEHWRAGLCLIGGTGWWGQGKHTTVGWMRLFSLTKPLINVHYLVYIISFSLWLVNMARQAALRGEADRPRCVAEGSQEWEDHRFLFLSFFLSLAHKLWLSSPFTSSLSIWGS